MDGRGSWRDDVFVEQLWRSVKYEEVGHLSSHLSPDINKSVRGHLQIQEMRAGGDSRRLFFFWELFS